MSTTALTCGFVDRPLSSARLDVHWVRVGPQPGREALDPVLAEVTDRLVVHGNDADFAAVVLRLLRKGRLSDVAVGYVPIADSPACELYGIAPGSAALHSAVDAQPRPTPLVRHDGGGVVIGSSVIEPITGQVYCDDQQVLHGSALRLEVTPDPRAGPLPDPTIDPVSTYVRPATDGLRVTSHRRGLLRRRRDTASGRAVQASFQESTVSCDGIAHPRATQRWGWYRHTEDLLLVRP